MTIPRRYPRLSLALLLALALLAPTLALTPPARADDCTVTSNLDSGPGTLRALLAGSCPGITFQPGLTSPITLVNTLPTIIRPLTITGPGKGSLTIQGNNTFPLLLIDAGALGGGPSDRRSRSAA